MTVKAHGKVVPIRYLAFCDMCYARLSYDRKDPVEIEETDSATRICCGINCPECHAQVILGERIPWSNTMSYEEYLEKSDEY